VLILEEIHLITGQTQIRKYERGALLGEGGFGKVYEILSIENNMVLAVKIIDKSKLTKRRTK